MIVNTHSPNAIVNMELENTIVNKGGRGPWSVVRGPWSGRIINNEFE